MKAIYQELINNSLSATLSAIEIYNKPDFHYRNETFVILIINAWELLLKAKILKDNNNDKTSLFVPDTRRESKYKYKRSRTGNHLTIEIRKALDKLDINSVVRENLDSLLDIRDTAVHFYNKHTISYTVFALGAATLQNYQTIIKEWFDKDLSTYNFYILPLGFKYSFKSFTTIDFSREPEAIQNLVKQITIKQNSGESEKDGYYLVADITAAVTTAKKLADISQSDFTISVDNQSDIKGIIRTQKIIDLYPYTARELCVKVKSALSTIKEQQIWNFIKENKIKDNKKYSAYNFPSKRAEKEYLLGNIKGTFPSLYNEDAIKYLVACLK